MSCLKYLAIAALVAPGPVHALGITIDDFSTTSDLIFDKDIGPGGTGTQTQTLQSGTERTISYDDNSSGSASFANSTAISFGRWIFNEASVGGTATLAYVFGTSGFDLSSQSAFRFGSVNNAEAGWNFSLDAMIEDLAANSASTTLTFDESDEGDPLTASFADFAGVDFSQVAELTLALSATGTGAAPDASISGPISAVPVPVPGALPLLGLCVVGYAVGARRKKTLQAA